MPATSALVRNKSQLLSFGCLLPLPISLDPAHPVIIPAHYHIGRQKGVSTKAQDSVAAMVELNADALEGSKIQAVTSDDLLKLAEVLRTELETFEFNDAYWTDQKRTKLRSETAAAAEKDEGEVELF